MRTTRASAAIMRLKTRSGLDGYSLALNASGLMHLTLMHEDGRIEALCEPMELDGFVAFVNAFGPQTPRRISKLDVAFEKQLTKKKDPV